MSFAPVLCALLISVGDDDVFCDKSRAQIEKLVRGGPNEANEALKLLKQMQEKLDAQNDPDWRLYVSWRRATCFYRTYKFAQAYEELRQGIAKAPDGHLIRYFMRLDLGEYYLRGFHLRRARPLLDDALEEAKKLHAHPIKFKETDKYKHIVSDAELSRIRLLIADYFKANGEDEKARTALEKIQKTIETNLKRLTAEWAELQTLDSNQKGVRARRQNVFEQYTEWKQRERDCQEALSDLDRHQGDPVGIIVRLRASLDGIREKTDPESTRQQFRYHVTLSANFWRIARFRDAESELDKAKAVLAGINFKGYAADLESTLATLRFEEIDFTFEEDLGNKDLLTPLGQAEKLAERALGRELAKVLDTDDELDYFQTSRIDLLAQIHELRGRVYAFQNQPEKAGDEYRLAGRAYDRVVKQLESMAGPGNDHVLAVRRRRARLALKRGTPKDLAVARTEALAAFELFKKSHGVDDVDRGDFLHLLATIEGRAGNFKEAAEHAEKHRELSARRLAGYLARLTAAEQITFFRRWDDPGLHAGLRLGIRDQALSERSAEWLINGKAKIAEVMAEILPLAGPKKNKELQQSVSRQALLLHGLVDGKDTWTKDELDAVKTRLLAEESRQRELVSKRQFVPRKWWYKLDVLRQGLRPSKDEVFIDVFCLRPAENGPRVYYAWIVPPAGKITVVELEKADVIEELVKKFGAHQAKVDNDYLNEVGPRKAEEILHKEAIEPLSRLVVDPIWKHAKEYTHWTISPDGPLWGIPWEALVLPGKGKHKYHYAIEEITFRYVISGRDLIKQPVANAKVGDPFIVADPDFNAAPAGPGWRRRLLRAGQLKEARKEGEYIADALRDYFGPREWRVQDRDVSKNTLLNLSPPPCVLYLATHGFARLNAAKLPADDPLLCCGVTLAGYNYMPRKEPKTPESLPGLITGAEVLSLNLHGTELVVLSACKTGQGPTDYGQSPADLRHAFHLAGARAVVSTLWSVDDRSTKEIMVYFMKLLAKRKLADKSAALRAAKLKQIEKLRGPNDEHSLPFFWAGLTLSGS
jgi:CHAT domain-containing protein